MYKKVIAENKRNFNKEFFEPNSITREQWNNKNIVMGIIDTWYNSNYTNSYETNDSWGGGWYTESAVSIMEKHGSILKYVGAQLRGDADVVAKVLEHDQRISTLDYIDTNLLKNGNFIPIVNKYSVYKSPEQLAKYVLRREILEKAAAEITESLNYSASIDRTTRLENFMSSTTRDNSASEDFLNGPVVTTYAYQPLQRVLLAAFDIKVPFFYGSSSEILTHSNTMWDLANRIAEYIENANQ